MVPVILGGQSSVLFALSIEPLTEAIRQNPQIHCITDQSRRQHKIALFTDDILHLQNPWSLILAPGCLHTSGPISGYRVNESKSEAVMLSGAWTSQLNDVVTSQHAQHVMFWFQQAETHTGGRKTKTRDQWKQKRREQLRAETKCVTTQSNTLATHHTHTHSGRRGYLSRGNQKHKHKC